MNTREKFLTRSPKDSVGRAVDEATLAQFDEFGLGEHPDVLAMLEAIIDPASSVHKFRAAKGKAYGLLEKVSKEANAKLAEQVEATISGCQSLKEGFHAAMICLEGIRATNPELIADNLPAEWGMNRFRGLDVVQPSGAEASA